MVWLDGDSVTIRAYTRGELRKIRSEIPDPCPEWPELIEDIAEQIVSIECSGELAGVAALIDSEVVAAFDRQKMRGHSRKLVAACRKKLDSWGAVTASCPIGDRHSTVWLVALGFTITGQDESDVLFSRGG